MRQQQAQTIELWPEHARAFAVFCAMASQWHCVPWSNAMSSGMHYQGLRYEALEVVERRLPADPADPAPDVVFAQLQVLEREALSHLNKP
jgi:hypothetical protein